MTTSKGRGLINYTLYNLSLVLGSPLVAGYLTERYVSGKSRPGWRERWGNLPDELKARPTSRPRVWVHAVSAGEVAAAVPILRELRELLPDHELVLSVITPDGHEVAEQQAQRYIDHLFYFPIDMPWVARKVVGYIRPTVFASLESELWPNLLHELKRQGSRTVMVNGRISENNYRRSKRIAGGLFRWMLSNVDRLLMQSALDAQRVRDLGGLSEPGKVAVIGNSKFDQEIERLSPEQALALRRTLKLPEQSPVFVAGSTRSPEEEAEVIAAYQAMRAEVPDLCLLIAPRHFDRGAELFQAMQAAGLSPVRRTQLNTVPSAEEQPVRHLILDTMGELKDVYAVAAIAFVGNSFLPVVKGGGQNLLQPLAHGKPVLFGPHTASIRSEVALVKEAGVGLQVANGAELAAQGVRLLQSADRLSEIEAHAIDLIAANRGVSRRYAQIVRDLAFAKPPFDTGSDLPIVAGQRGR